MPPVIFDSSPSTNCSQNIHCNLYLHHQEFWVPFPNTAPLCLGLLSYLNIVLIQWDLQNWMLYIPKQFWLVGHDVPIRPCLSKWTQIFNFPITKIRWPVMSWFILLPVLNTRITLPSIQYSGNSPVANEDSKLRPIVISSLTKLG